MKHSLREIDALVAEHVMGWTYMDSETGTGQKILAPSKSVMRRIQLGGCLDSLVPKYSSSIEAAWSVAQKIVDMDEEVRFAINIYQSRYEECEIEIRYWDLTDPNDPVTVDKFVLAKTAPLAICLAALKAKGINTEPLVVEKEA